MQGAPSVGALTELGPAQVASAPPAGPPRAGLPQKSTLDYLKTAIEVLLLLLAVPWILRELTRHPGKVSKAAAGHHLKGG